MRDRPIKHQLRRLKYLIYCVMRLLVISSGRPLLWKLFPPGKLAMSFLNFFWNGQKSHMSGEGESHLLSQGEGIKKWPKFTSDKLGTARPQIKSRLQTVRIRRFHIRDSHPVDSSRSGGDGSPVQNSHGRLLLQSQRCLFV